MTELPEPDQDADAPAPRVWVRLAALGVMVVALLLLGRISGLSSHVRVSEIRAAMTAAGWWGPIAFVGAFTLGELVHVPGLVFVAAAVVSYGRPFGGALAYVGAVVSLSTCFVVVRAVGGKPLGMIRWRAVRRVLAELDDHPIRTVFLLRLVLWLTPQVNYLLALSHVRFRHYLVGSVAGLILPIAILAFAFDRLAFLVDRIAQ